jgi:hypothetical protein
MPSSRLKNSAKDVNVTEVYHAIDVAKEKSTSDATADLLISFSEGNNDQGQPK